MKNPQTLAGLASRMCAADVEWAAKFITDAIPQAGRNIPHWEKACEVLSVAFLACRAGIKIKNTKTSFVMRKRESLGLT